MDFVISYTHGGDSSDIIWKFREFIGLARIVMVMLPLSTRPGWNEVVTAAV